MNKRITPYPLRLPAEVRETIEQEARRNRRSLNAELCLLLEEALAHRKKR